MNLRHLTLFLGVAAMTSGSAQAQAQPQTASSRPCDPVFHDKLVGATDRSPSECEVQFDTLIREAEHRAFAGVVEALAQAHWVVKSETAVAPITGIARNTQKEPFRPSVTTGGGYGLTLALDPASVESQAYVKRWNDLGEKMGQEVAATGKSDGPAFVAFAKLNADALIKVYVSVNDALFAPGEFVSFVVAHTVLQVPGATYAVASSQVQGLGGGGASDAVPSAAFVYLGKWGPATFEKLSDGGERMRINSVMNPAALPLSVQTFAIRMECNAALRDTILQHMDLTALRSLLPR